MARLWLGGGGEPPRGHGGRHADGGGSGWPLGALLGLLVVVAVLAAAVIALAARPCGYPAPVIDRPAPTAQLSATSTRLPIKVTNRHEQEESIMNGRPMRAVT